MAIYEPKIERSEAEGRAIALLNLLLERAAGSAGSANSGEHFLEISPAEAGELADFLFEFVRSRKFVEAAYFTESLSGPSPLSNDRAKEIYLSWRTRLGKTRVASTFTWNEFVVRAGFGFTENAQMYVRAYRHPVQPMPLKHFLAMEVRLARAYGLSKTAIQIISDYYERRLGLIDELRRGQKGLARGTVEKCANEIAESFDAVAKCSPHRTISKPRLAACTGLIMDVGAFFITRDWTATGVASVAGSTFPDLVGVE